MNSEIMVMGDVGERYFDSGSQFNCMATPLSSTQRSIREISELLSVTGMNWSGGMMLPSASSILFQGKIENGQKEQMEAVPPEGIPYLFASTPASWMERKRQMAATIAVQGD